MLAVGGWAVPINYVWELAQSPLYVGMDTLGKSWWHCLVASIGDAFLVLLIFGAGWAMFRELDWFTRRGAAGAAFGAASGVVVAILVEWAALSVRRWSYTPEMPLIPIADVGVLPVLQMALLPPLMFRIASLRTPNAGTTGDDSGLMT